MKTRSGFPYSDLEIASPIKSLFSEILSNKCKWQQVYFPTLVLSHSDMLKDDFMDFYLMLELWDLNFETFCFFFYWKWKSEEADDTTVRNQASQRR